MAVLHMLVLGGTAITVGAATYVALGWVNATRKLMHAQEASAHTIAASRLPWLWRLAWPVLRFLELRLRRWLPSGEGHRALIIAAGLPQMVNARHVVLAQGLSATLAAVAVLLLGAISAATFDRIPAAAMAGAGAAIWGAQAPVSWLRKRRASRLAEATRELPLILDLLALCIQGGGSTQGALHTCAHVGPEGVLRAEIRHMLTELRTGMGQEQAYADLTRRLPAPAVRTWVEAMLQSARMGTSLGDALRELAETEHEARFERAERLAMLAPVKLLVPLILCSFPCTFLVIGFPIVMTMLGSN